MDGAQATFITANRPHLAVIIDSGYTEHDHALGFDQAVQQALPGIPGMLFDEGLHAFHDPGDSL